MSAGLPERPEALGERYQASLSAAHRKRHGVHYTPAPVVDEVVAAALRSWEQTGDRGARDTGLDPGGAPAGPALPGAVCDPACGGGAFLLGVGRALVARGLDRAEVATRWLWGADLDPQAVAVSRRAIEAWAGVAPPAEHLVVGDGLALADRPGWRGRFDLVVGNPPFQSQLATATVRAEALASWLDELRRPYTDTAWLFLAVADVLADPHRGVVALVQPQSLAGARDAGAVRDRLDQRRRIVDAVTIADGTFEAAVRVWAPVLAPRPADHGPARGPWRTWLPRPDPAAQVILDGHRSTDGGGDTGQVGDRATITAGFRRQFYGLAPHVREATDGELASAGSEVRGQAAPLVTAGLIDVGGCAWGHRGTRLAGVRYRAPVVDLGRLRAGDDPGLASWVQDRLRPKVVVANQTKVLEAAVDPHGVWVPSTPVVSVEPHDEADLWRIAAALSSPPVSAWAYQRSTGLALSPDAIKVAAADLRAVPLPADRDRWQQAADQLAAGADVFAVAHTMTEAYRAGPEVHAWWARRAGNAGADRGR